MDAGEVQNVVGALLAVKQLCDEMSKAQNKPEQVTPAVTPTNATSVTVAQSLQPTADKNYQLFDGNVGNYRLKPAPIGLGQMASEQW